MKDKRIVDRIRSRRFYLSKIESRRIHEIPKQDSIKMNQEVEYEILENNDEKLSIKLNTRVFMEPDTLFSIELEHIIEYILNDPISNEEINGEIDMFLNSLGSEVSYIISILTKEMFNSPMVLPPKLNIKVK